MYKLFDNQGRILVLRPDITIPIGRIAGTKLKESDYPLKLSYCLNVFRANDNLNGRRNEFTQSGVEIIGCGNFKGDVEVIVTAVQALLKAGIENFKLELGHVQFYKGIAEESQIDSSSLEKIRIYIENKNFGALKDLLEFKGTLIEDKTKRALNSLPRLFGDIRVIEEGRKITKSEKALGALDNIENIYRVLDKMGLSKHVTIDLGLVNHINYYTGLVFRGYVEGFGEDVLYGGRYDSLIKRFGWDTPATGFAINVDGILETLSKQNYKEKRAKADFIIWSEERYIERANMLINSISEKGSICELSLLESLRETKDYALRKNIDKVLIVEDERTLVYDIQSEIAIEYTGMEADYEKSHSGAY